MVFWVSWSLHCNWGCTFISGSSWPLSKDSMTSPTSFNAIKPNTNSSASLSQNPGLDGPYHSLCGLTLRMYFPKSLPQWFQSPKSQLMFQPQKTSIHYPSTAQKVSCPQIWTCYTNSHSLGRACFSLKAHKLGLPCLHLSQHCLPSSHRATH